MSTADQHGQQADGRHPRCRAACFDSQRQHEHESDRRQVEVAGAHHPTRGRQRQEGQQGGHQYDAKAIEDADHELEV